MKTKKAKTARYVQQPPKEKRKNEYRGNYSKTCYNCQPPKLVASIENKNLTDALDALERHGFSGDLAVFFLAIAQEVA